MNYHCIEYLIKERRREEIEECNRLRMLKRAGCLDTGYLQGLSDGILKRLKNLSELITNFGRTLMRYFLRRVSMINSKGRV